jgi:hypothetical protein
MPGRPRHVGQRAPARKGPAGRRPADHHPSNQRRPMHRRTLCQLTYLAAALSLGCHLDHLIRHNAVGWPLTDQVDAFTISLVGYPIIATGLLLYQAGRVAGLSGGAAFVSAVHFGPGGGRGVHPGPDTGSNLLQRPARLSPCEIATCGWADDQTRGCILGVDLLAKHRCRRPGALQLQARRGRRTGENQRWLATSHSPTSLPRWTQRTP